MARLDDFGVENPVGFFSLGSSQVKSIEFCFLAIRPSCVTAIIIFFGFRQSEKSVFTKVMFR